MDLYVPCKCLFAMQQILNEIEKVKNVKTVQRQTNAESNTFYLFSLSLKYTSLNNLKRHNPLANDC